jgi:hypothetical protein
MTEEDVVRLAGICIRLLSETPQKAAIAFWFETKDEAVDYAQKINLGLNDLFDPTVYWAGPDREDEEGMFPMFIGLRSHMPESWRKFVTGE